MTSVSISAFVSLFVFLLKTNCQVDVTFGFHFHNHTTTERIDFSDPVTFTQHHAFILSNKQYLLSHYS